MTEWRLIEDDEARALGLPSPSYPGGQPWHYMMQADIPPEVAVLETPLPETGSVHWRYFERRLFSDASGRRRWLWCEEVKNDVRQKGEEGL